MIWHTWRQHRGQWLFVLAGLVVTAAVVVPVGLGMHRAFVELGVADCMANMPPTVPTDPGPLAPGVVTCAELADAFWRQYGPRALGGLILLVVVPLLVGLVVGTQLVADDVDHGTHRFVWTQGLTRRRWSAAKLGLACAVAAVVAGGYGLLGHWYTAPLVPAAGGRLVLTDLLGTAPVAYALFAVALGAFTGATLRKVPPALAATLFGFVVARLAVRRVRPHLLPPLERKLPVYWHPTQTDLGNPLALRLTGDWDVGIQTYDAAGPLAGVTGGRFCPSPLPSSASPLDLECNTPVFGVAEYNLQLYHPDSRFWTFQLIETGIFVVLAALLILLALRQIQRIT
jgi:hypothetical protein